MYHVDMIEFKTNPKQSCKMHHTTNWRLLNHNVTKNITLQSV